MKSFIFYIIIFIFLIGTSISLEAQIRLLTIGDSTMADYDLVKNSEEKEKRGWGQMLPLFFNDNVKVENAARNGRSTKSFYFELWDTQLRESLKPGDYVIIQFGHNDEKNNGKDTSEKDKKERGTAPWSQYVKYLTKYVEESRAKGAIPVLATPVVRRMFNEDGKTLAEKGKHNLVEYADVKNDSILNYVLAMKSVARNLSVPLIDMTALTEQLVTEYGPQKSKERIYCEEDNTHLRTLGAILFAELFAKDLARQNILKDHIVFSKETIFPKELDFGSQLVSVPMIKAFSMVSIGVPGSKEIDIASQSPYLVSFYPDKDYSLNITSYADGNFNGTVYVKFIPEQAATYNRELSFRVNSGETNIFLPLAGAGIAADKNKVIEIKASPAKSAINVKGDISVTTGLKGMRTSDNNSIETPDGLNESSALEIDLNTARYVELAIKADSYEVYLNHIAFSLKSESGDRMQFTVLGSLYENFVKTDSFSVMENMSDKALKPYSFNTMVHIPKGKTYRLRFYPWNRGGDKSKIVLDNVLIKGLGK